MPCVRVCKCKFKSFAVDTGLRSWQCIGPVERVSKVQLTVEFQSLNESKTCS